MLLFEQRELSKSYESHIKQLQKDISESKSEVTRVESSMVEALAAKNSEIEALVNSMDALKKQAASSEGNLSSLQVEYNCLFLLYKYTVVEYQLVKKNTNKKGSVQSVLTLKKQCYFVFTGKHGVYYEKQRAYRNKNDAGEGYFLSFHVQCQLFEIYLLFFL